MDVDAEKLLKLVKARQPIYIRKTNGNKKKLWQEIAAEMNWSVTDCKTKWMCLRNAYCRHLRGLPLDRYGKERRKWYLADAMAFLSPHVRSNYSGNNSLDSQDAEEFKSETASVLDESVHSITSSIASAEEDVHVFGSVKYELSPETKVEISDGFVQEDGTEVGYEEPEDGGKVYFPECSLGGPQEDADTEATLAHRVGGEKVYFPECSLGRPQEDTGREVTFAQPEDREKVYFPGCSLGQPREDANLLFFKSLYADYGKLSSRRQRAFKMQMLNKMQELQEEDENELLGMRRPPQTGPPGNITFKGFQN
ncbi:uncharacterized protein LOC105664966 [Ceratitis capitata]|uniref:(Mediterranean fruit fly) hypothetical protein n=2 Tax=Ceratitis capitata TaxID=7213 RepID=A0A811UZU8_CERCA|nr:uncharacterized protein LOC105664966 [Ceratitis capitata]CAD7004380.1 unnamed protein product [Ceratitis capitata]